MPLSTIFQLYLGGHIFDGVIDLFDLDYFIEIGEAEICFFRQKQPLSDSEIFLTTCLGFELCYIFLL